MNTNTPKSKDPPAMTEQVCVLGRGKRDTAHIWSVLEAERIHGWRCESIDSLCARLDETAALLITEEALEERATEQLIAALEQQPDWSDIPLLLLTRNRTTEEAQVWLSHTLPRLGNVTVLQRPVKPMTLASAARVALRGRQRQFAMRDQVKRIRRTEHSLQRMHDELERANDDMARFFSMISHDLKHPAVGIETLMRLLQDDGESALSDEAKQNVEMILGECVRMKQMLRRLSNLGKLIHDPPKYQPTHLPRLVQSCFNPFKSLIQRRKIRTVRHVAARSLLLPRWHIEQILINLLDNAIRHGCVGGERRIDVRVELNSVDCRFSVMDRGPGIKTALHEKIFKPFHRFNTQTGQYGTGIGLAGVRLLAHRIGGKIELQSQPGRGACFTLIVSRHDPG